MNQMISHLVITESLIISRLHYTQVQKSGVQIFNGYVGTRSKLIRVPGRQFITSLDSPNDESY